MRSRRLCVLARRADYVRDRLTVDGYSMLSGVDATASQVGVRPFPAHCLSQAVSAYDVSHAAKPAPECGLGQRVGLRLALALVPELARLSVVAGAALESRPRAARHGAAG